MIGTILAVASFGLNIMGANEQKAQAEEQQRFIRGSEALSRRLIATERRAATETLARDLRGTLGTQRAVQGFFGIAGGATATAFEADARAAAAREQSAIDIRAETELALSRQAEKAGVARAAAQSAQANIDLFASAISTADTLRTISQQRTAQGV